MVVYSTSFVSVLFPIILSMPFLQLQTICLQTPPQCAAPGGWNSHFICLWAKYYSMSDWFQAAIHSRVSCCTQETCFVITWNHIRSPSPLDESRNSSKKCVCFKTGQNFNMYSSCYQTCEWETPSFCWFSTEYHFKRSKILYSRISKWEYSFLKFFFRLFCHDRLNFSNLLLSALNTYQFHFFGSVSESDFLKKCWKLERTYSVPSW